MTSSRTGLGDSEGVPMSAAPGAEERLETILRAALSQAWFARGGQQPTWDKFVRETRKKVVAEMKAYTSTMSTLELHEEKLL